MLDGLHALALGLDFLALAGQGFLLAAQLGEALGESLAAFGLARRRAGEFPGGVGAGASFRWGAGSAGGAGCCGVSAMLFPFYAVV